MTAPGFTLEPFWLGYLVALLVCVGWAWLMTREAQQRDADTTEWEDEREMASEIVRLRASVDTLTCERDEARKDAISAWAEYAGEKETSAQCLSYLRQSEDMVDALTSKLDEARRERDGAYRERNQVVAWAARLSIAAGYVVRVTKTAIDGWDVAWHNCVYVMTPTGQASWHFHDDDAHLFADLPHGDVVWDGHTTPEKYDRLHCARYTLEARADTRLVTDAMVKRAWECLCDLALEKQFGMLNGIDKEDVQKSLTAALSEAT